MLLLSLDLNPIHVQVTEISYPLILKALLQRACDEAAGVDSLRLEAVVTTY